MDSNNIFDFVGDAFRNEINAFLLDNTGTANLKVELIVSKIQQLPILNSSEINEQSKIDFKLKIEVLKKNNSIEQDATQLIKDSINNLIAENISNKKQELVAIRKRKLNFRVIGIVGIVIVSITLIALFQHKKNKDTESVVTANEILEAIADTTTEKIEPTTTPKSKGDSLKKETETITEIKEKTSDNIQFEKLILKQNQRSFRENFPVESFTIMNNNTAVIRISSISISITNFDGVLATTKTRELLPESKYSIELKPKKAKEILSLKYPIQIDANDAATIEVLFFSKTDKGFVEPLNIGKFTFQISFNTDSVNYKTNELKLSY